MAALDMFRNIASPPSFDMVPFFVFSLLLFVRRARVKEPSHSEKDRKNDDEFFPKKPPQIDKKKKEEEDRQEAQKYEQRNHYYIRSRLFFNHNLLAETLFRMNSDVVFTKSSGFSNGNK